jgi:putative heme-binding domain-containing protein
LTSLRNGAADVYARLAESKLLDTAKAKPWVEALVAQLDRQPHSEGHDQIERNNFLITVARLTRMAEKDQNAAAYVQMTLEAASPKLARAIHEATQGKSHQILRQGVAAALLIAPVSTVSTEKRVAAIERLRFSDWTEARPVLNELLAPTEPLEIQTAALATISTFGGRSAVEDIAGRFPAMSPMLKARAADVLCGSNLSMGILLDEIEGRRIAAADLSPAHWKLLVDHRDFEIHHRAAKLFEAIRPADRKSVVEEYRDSLSLAGSAERGKQIFTKQCSTCHKVDGVGHEIGPSLAAAILVNVLDPNREVNPQFVGYAVQTTDGRALSGLIAAESATSITLKRAEGATDTVLRIDIEQLKSTGQSLMPEGLEKQIDRQAMADLLAYLLQ